MGKGHAARKPNDSLQLKAKQSAKLAEIRDALVGLGFDSVAKQATALGVGRSTAWALLNRDKRAGPKPLVIRRILSSRKLPPEVRRKVEEYVAEKIKGLYGHSKPTRNRNDLIPSRQRAASRRVRLDNECPLSGF